MSGEQTVEKLSPLPGAAGSSTARAIREARAALIARQHASGHWLFELEAD
jgi:hypothetical protein